MKTDYVEPHTRRCRHTIDFVEESLTLQAHKDECDVNNIVARFNATRVLPHLRTDGIYEDVSEVSRMDLTERIALSRSVEQRLREHSASEAAKPVDKPGAQGGASEPAPAPGAVPLSSAAAPAPAGGPAPASG